MTLTAAVLEAFFRRHRLLHTPGVVAISGGPDSTALAHLFTQLSQSGQLGLLTFAHLNHQLRGPDSDADEAFVLELPTRWQATQTAQATSRRDDTAANAQKLGANLESHARDVRYAWLNQVAAENRAVWIATGHTADDQAETVLHRLLRGAGLRGLGGMAPCRPCADGVLLVRPLLKVKRSAVLAYLAEHHLDYRLDASNQDRRFKRNRLRLDVIPQLQRDVNPALVEALNHLAEQARAAHADIARLAQRLLEQAELPAAGTLRVFSSAKLQEVSDYLLGEMFHLVWQREGWPLGEMGQEQWQHLAEVVRGERSAWDLPGGIHARRREHVIQIGPLAA